MQNTLDRRGFLKATAIAAVSLAVPACLREGISETNAAAAEAVELDPVDELMEILETNGYIVSRVRESTLQTNDFTRYRDDSVVIQVWPEGTTNPNDDWIFDIYVLESVVSIHWYSSLTEKGVRADCYSDKKDCSWGVTQEESAEYKRKVDFRDAEEAADYIMKTVGKVSSD